MTGLPELLLDRVVSILQVLPRLPSALRYYDNYLDETHYLRDIVSKDCWSIQHDGVTSTLDFGRFSEPFQHLIKHVIVDMLGKTDVTYVTIRFDSMVRALELLGDDLLLNCLLLTAPEIRSYWIEKVSPTLSNKDGNSIKSLLRSFCALYVGPWKIGMEDYISLLPVSKIDVYKTVRTGDCFVPIDQQSCIVDYFDELATLVSARPDQIDISDLRDACVLIVSHQHGLRPGQIARIRVPDVRFHSTGAVHFSTVLLKQRRGEALRRVTRRVKREWCPLFIEYDRRRRLLGVPDGVARDAFFILTPAGVTYLVKNLSERLTGEGWTPTELRHTAAQRLADAGVSHMALSEFLGHASIRTGNVYFDTSPTQAQRVNQALALSPIYANVAEVARTRTIDKAALLRLPPDKQIGGAPHGIPIAGIGGCAVGQSGCTKNPILSCYNCRKFMPVKDADVHEGVVESLRTVVLEFADASRGNNESPAYTLLRHTLTAAQQVAADIRAREDVTTSPEEMQTDE